MNDTPTTGGASLRRALLFALGLAVVVWIVASFAIARSILIDSMLQHEIEDGVALGQRVLRLVDLETARIERSSRDWAHWDESWSYVQGRQPDYVARNVQSDVLENLEIDLFALVAADDSIRLVLTRDGTAPPDPVPALLGHDGAWLDAQRSGHTLRGLVATGAGVLAFVAQPIHRTQPEDRGPSPGTLVFARFLDADFVAQLAQVLGVELTLNAPTAPDVGAALRHLEVNSIHVSPLDDRRLVTYAVLRDLWGQPAAVFRTVTARTAHTLARRAELGLLLATLAIGLAAGLAFYGFMANRIFAPFHRLGAAVRGLARGNRGARLAPATFDDEFARLASEVNAMLDERDAQRERREASDAARLATRMRSEMLAKLGHATAAPFEELKRALEEALHDDTLSSATRARLDEAYRNAFRLATELDSLPSAPVAAPETVTDLAPVALTELVEEIAETAAARAASRGVTVDCEVDPTLAARYLGDASRLRSILTQLFEALENEAPKDNLVLRARLGARAAESDSIELCVSRCALRPSLPIADPAPEDTLSDARTVTSGAAELGAEVRVDTDSEPGLHRVTAQWVRVADAAVGTKRLHLEHQTLVLGPAHCGRDVVEAYLKALGCQVTAVELVSPTTPRDLALVVAFVTDPGAEGTFQAPLPGVPTIFVLPAAAPLPARNTRTSPASGARCAGRR